MAQLRWSHRTIVLALCGAGVVIAVACSEGDSPSRLVGPTRATSALRGRAYAGLSTTQRARVQQARTNAAWIGRIHNDVMTDLMSRKKDWRGRSRAAKCRVLLDAVLGAIPRVRTESGTELTEAQLRHMTAVQFSHDPRCGSETANIFASNATLASSVGWAQDDGADEVTDAGMAFAQSVVNAANATDGMPGSVSEATNDALAAGYALSDSDFYVGAQAAEQAVSSSEEWYEQAESGALDSLGVGQPYSLWIPAWLTPVVAYVAGVDALGCVGGGAIIYAVGDHSAKHIALGCWIGGAVASGGVALAI